MDPLTHGLVGAAATQSIAGRKTYRAAAFTGFVSAMLADLDFFIHNPADPLLNIEIHRQFTHSLIFIPAGALIACGILWWVMRKHLSFRELYLYCLVSYGTAGLMDAATSYGTMLLWPFDTTRYAWNLISVVDPVFTAGLLAFAGISFFKKEKRFARLAWAWLFLYLAIGLVQRERAASSAHELAEQRGHTIERIDVKPTIGNLLLWRSTYEYDDRFYADGIRVGPFSAPLIYQGESADRVHPAEVFDPYMASVMYHDIMRFSRLSEEYLVFHPERPGVIGDARYSMLPTSLTPLWGIRVDTDEPEEHVDFLYFRDTAPEVRRRYLHMLLGR